MSVKICVHASSNCFNCYWNTNNCANCNQFNVIVDKDLCYDCFNNKNKSICKECNNTKSFVKNGICINCIIPDICIKCKQNPSSLDNLCYDCLQSLEELSF